MQKNNTTHNNKQK